MSKMELKKIEELDSFLDQAAHWLLQQQIDGERWDCHSYLGSHFVAQLSLCLKWLGRKSSVIDDEHLKALLLRQQLPDGSWHQVKDLSHASGELNATIFNYWFLKTAGLSNSDPALEKAQKFILAAGGIEASSMFTKVFLALFAEFPWPNLPVIPYVLFTENLPMNYKNFSQWVVPHLIPMSYLRTKQVAKPCSERLSQHQLFLGELWTGEAPNVQIETKAVNSWPLPISDVDLIKKALAQRQPQGSWGGYTVATLLMSMALDHFGGSARKGLVKSLNLDQVIDQAIHFIEQLYVGDHDCSYMGCLMDGHYWDTSLSINALLQAGVDPQRLLKSRDYILATQTSSGAFPYGFDFEYAPDIDDTAEVMHMMAHWPEDCEERLEKSAHWMLNMQNKDGGWGAFDKNNVGNAFLRAMTQSYNDSVDVFDDSSADCTGNVLEALSLVGQTQSNSLAVRRGADYLRKQQLPGNGAWTGRWAVNYLFGTTCVLAGLIKSGEPVQSPCVQKALQFLLAQQNPDGGFGESTDSYLDVSKAGKGPSTPSQTAWVLLALLQAGLVQSAAVEKAVDYLISVFKKTGEWKDGSVTGTGHPGLLYMVYPSYARAYPILALGLYRAQLQAQ